MVAATWRRDPTTLVAFVVAALLVAARCADAGRIINLITPSAHSHLMNQKKISTELAARGHDVVFVAAEADVQWLQPTNIPILSYDIPQLRNKSLRVTHSAPRLQFFMDWHAAGHAGCGALMGNATLLSSLKDFNADVMLAEMLFFCTPILASKLDKPWINFFPAAPIEPLTTFLYHLFLPNPISYNPQSYSQITTQRMNFRQRLYNAYRFWAEHLFNYRVHGPEIARLYKTHNFDPRDAKEKSRLVLSMAPIDPALEWTRPWPPSFKLVGAILAEPGKPLPADIEFFLESSGKGGVLLVSLGTIAELGPMQRRSMAAVFANLPCKVLWQLSPKEVPNAAALAEMRIGNNTKVMHWLPQNDILADHRTRAFMNHAGVNSMYEALYHGKPILASAFVVDQFPNAAKIVGQGVGRQVSSAQLGTPAHEAALVDVLTNPRFKERAIAMSVKLRARKRTPLQEAADLVEHVMETGGEPYLQSPEAAMSIFVRHSVDVYSMILLTVGLGLFVAWEALRHACSYLARAPACSGRSHTSFANVMCRFGLFLKTLKTTKLKFS